MKKMMISLACSTLLSMSIAGAGFAASTGGMGANNTGTMNQDGGILGRGADTINRAGDNTMNRMTGTTNTTGTTGTNGTYGTTGYGTNGVNNGNNGNYRTNNTTRNGNGNYRANAANNNDNDMDWGWLGLLGLIGLAGMRNRNKEPQR